MARALTEPGERCPARHIPAGALDDLVWRDLCEVPSTPEMIAHAMARARGGHWLPQELQARRTNLRRGRAALTQRLERLTKAYLAGATPLAEYGRRRRDTDGRLRALDGQERELTRDAERQDRTAGLASHAEAFCRRVGEGLAGADFARRRALLELLVDRVVVADGEVEIRYAVPTGPDRSRRRVRAVLPIAFRPSRPRSDATRRSSDRSYAPAACRPGGARPPLPSGCSTA